MASANLTLIYNSTRPHFAFLNENGLYKIPNILNLTGNINIQPLYCSDTDINAYPFLSSGCIAQGETITIFIKEDNVTVNVNGSLVIDSIFFDGRD